MTITCSINSTDATCELQLAIELAEQQLANQRTVPVLYQALRTLVQPINCFFDNVFVMDENLSIRQTNLVLLQRVANLPNGLVDLTQLTKQPIGCYANAR